MRGSMIMINRTPEQQTQHDCDVLLFVVVVLYIGFGLLAAACVQVSIASPTLNILRVIAGIGAFFLWPLLVLVVFVQWLGDKS